MNDLQIFAINDRPFHKTPLRPVEIETIRRMFDDGGDTDVTKVTDLINGSWIRVVDHDSETGSAVVSIFRPGMSRSIKTKIIYGRSEITGSGSDKTGEGS